MHDLMFENQTSGGLENPALEGYAATVGLDLVRFKQAMADGRHASAVDADAAAAQAAEISGTPSFVINGYYVSGAQPLRAFTRVVDRALRERQPKAAGPR
jgi:predicted DsbA family dithiol-disulfide isomerase